MNEELSTDVLNTTIERLAAAAAMLEKAAESMASRESQFREEIQSTVERIVATVDQQDELAQKLAEAEAQIVALRAQMEEQGGRVARKTLPVTMATLLAKQGVSGVERLDAGALDGALASLSIEQRIAVKSELLRAGLAG